MNGPESKVWTLFKEFLFLALLWLLVVTLLVCLNGCVTSQKQAQRKINRLVAKFPGLRTADTLLIQDTIIRNGVRVDTLFKPGRDTVIIKEGKMTIRHFYNREIDTVFVDGECETDTIYYEKRVPVEMPHTESTWKDDLVKYWGVLVLVAGLLVIVIFKK